LLAALAPSLAHADVESDTARAAAALTAGIRAHDARAIGKQLAASFTNGGVWFADPACAREFAEPGEVTGKRVSVFARCLAKHRVQLSTRESSRREGAVLTVEPGIEIELAFRGPHVRWIGHPLHAATGAIVPTLTAQAFEALRTRGTTALDAVLTPEALEIDARAATSAWIKLCIDERGARTHVDFHGASSGAAGKAFVRAIEDWTFRPFEVRGTPIPVCSLSYLTYPATKAPPIEVLPATSMPVSRIQVHDLDDLEDLELLGGFGPPPAPPPAPQTVTPVALERLRLTGTKQIDPDPATRAQMIGAGKLSVLTSVKLCVNVRGYVSSTSLNKSSGFPAYDKKLLYDIRHWTFKPYVVAHRAIDVCTTVSFVVVPDPTMLNP